MFGAPTIAQLEDGDVRRTPSPASEDPSQVG